MDILTTGTGMQPNPPVADGGRTQAQRDSAPDSTSASAQTKSPKEQLTESQRNDAVKQFKTNVESLSSANLSFSIDKDTGRTVVKVVDNETGKTIQQIPSETVLALNKELTRAQGMLLHDKA
jgi:flagellar protein FlaG